MMSPGLRMPCQSSVALKCSVLRRSGGYSVGVRGGRGGVCSVTASAASTSSSGTQSSEAALDVVRRSLSAEKGGETRQLFESLVELNRIKGKGPEHLLETLADESSSGGGGARQDSEGNFWKLCYTVSKDNLITATTKGSQEVKGKGVSSFPITAVQNWNMQNMRIQNGVFLGKHIFSLIFSGDFEVSRGKILYFDFDRLDIKLGPLEFGFDLPEKAQPKTKRPSFGGNQQSKGAKGGGKEIRPFFIFIHADDQFCVARGRGGGIAVWQKVDVKWRFENGVYV